MSPTPCSRAAIRSALVCRIASTREMCRSKKSINGQVERCSSSRISVTAVVENANGVTGPSIALSRMATTRRASSTVEMKGNNRRSKCRSGNWISSALPIVSALMPVASDRKYTGTVTLSSTATPLILPHDNGPGGYRRGRAVDGSHRRRTLVGVVLGRHQDPQQRVDQDLAARDRQQDDDEQQAGDPRVEAEPPCQARAHPADDPAFPGADQALARHRVVDGVHVSLASFEEIRVALTPSMLRPGR